MSYIELIRFILVFAFSHGGNQNHHLGGGDVVLMWKAAHVAFQYLLCFFAKILFRLRIVLSRLFVSKIQPEVCSSVCECS